MISRLIFAVIVAFWLTMNFLLWRSQMVGHHQIGNAIRPAAVWQKILTAPDNSSLDIYDRDKKVGFCHWIATVGESSLAQGKVQTEDYEPEGMVEQVTGYTLNFEGNTALSSSRNRIRFESSLKLSTNQVWQDFHFRASLKPTTWDVHAIAAARKVYLKVDDLTGGWQRTIKFSELEDPQALMQDLGGPMAFGLLGTIGLPMDSGSVSNLASSITWDAHEDQMQFGHSKVRVYRLETQVLGQHIYVFISQVGEILWVELPNHITLRNEAFGHF